MKTTHSPSLFQVSEIQVSYFPKFKASERPNVTCSKDAEKIFRQHWNSGKMELSEQFFVMLLNRGNRVIGLSEVSSGGVSGTVVDAKLIFAMALKAHASQIILAHNHPSGCVKPSTADLSITRRLIEAGKFLDLPVIDHLILTIDGYFSFGDEGLI